MSTPENAILTAPEERKLLSIARTTLETFVQDSVPAKLDSNDCTPTMNQKRACFITLRTEDAELRGCIGSTAHTSPLVQAVRDNTIKSASRDPRFDPVTSDELPGLSIEISALADGDTADSPFRRIESPDEIHIGRDGLYIEFDGIGRGLLLPQVASERDWNVEAFLIGLCRKSGLDAKAWQDPRAVLHRFSVQVFSE